jgi:hypothetical protein
MDAVLRPVVAFSLMTIYTKHTIEGDVLGLSPSFVGESILVLLSTPNVTV